METECLAKIKACPRCGRRYSVELVCCANRDCGAFGNNHGAEGRILPRLWITEPLPDGATIWHPPESLNRSAVRRLALARTSGRPGPDDDAA